MIGMLLEAVVIAFVIGGIVGAVTALHLSTFNSNNKVPVRIESQNQRQQRNRH